MKFGFFLLLFLFCSVSLAQSEKSYVLGAGDKVEIKVFGQPDLEVTALLGNSGEVNYPFLGKVTLSGLNISEVEQVIANGLRPDYLVNPNVYVQVVQYRPFYIHGEVKSPGAYPYQPAMTVNQAIALAGGLTERASTEKIFIYKEQTKQQQQKGNLNSKIAAGDTIKIEQRLF
ncbi:MULTISPECIES: polysaccharide biosynthesis/export family protein [Pseudoalteromonas]|jgi:polysaccharide export outer membrane protein|uniref:polysaccharide biosynthesis/export family protein n=1 Tax=Pseudoalteromonas TaxID=53246 RepID=UPI0002C9B12C|nr:MULTISPECIES: polysaccharide biosynthesis/export family protein [Pseudoalteromonas]MCP4053724.1 polysaccharide export protein [Mesoflavibacter sp.]ENN98689.1 polysaccharide export-related protein [Pseudoalteromonas agarivorans S816]MDI3245355.1 polysaccharide biosynthesis/export family protein [Pseudoalteromonas agarivorans]TMS70483.1 capsular biosynthesis protein [Pseudoalteromonas sp. S1691]TMS72125.1 capsular biosynthesis protein [Pseudoalteromonas sp. S1731]|tara:strand:- start:5179 stop:5697 length:519 start_codon:yes stop_codon:yes gene_type:complete